MATLDDAGMMQMFFVPMLNYLWPESEALNMDLRERILAREQSSPGQSKTNVGGWQSTEDFQKWAGDAGQALIERAVALVNHATGQLLQHYGTQEEIGWKVAIWANVNRRGQYNQIHIHPGSTWSGVYYVDAGERPTDQPHNGVLTFINPNLASAATFFPKTLPNRIAVTPEAGRMVLFPSYLQHLVHPYWGERPRISVAFNVQKQPYP